MKIDQMKRQQLEALAFRLGIERPNSYDIPELKRTLKAHYAQKKRRERRQ